MGILRREHSLPLGVDLGFSQEDMAFGPGFEGWAKFGK